VKAEKKFKVKRISRTMFELNRSVFLEGVFATVLMVTFINLLIYVIFFILLFKE